MQAHNASKRKDYSLAIAQQGNGERSAAIEEIEKAPQTESKMAGSAPTTLEKPFKFICLHISFETRFNSAPIQECANRHRANPAIWL